MPDLAHLFGVGGILVLAHENVEVHGHAAQVAFIAHFEHGGVDEQDLTKDFPRR